ncbi:hypothetical protein PICMEDRAFT_85093 [Pichia membranifaciens NRRL Y-2026]|uniref:Uncharacterized protein n=1 Tax=Pichia membranifaciens NRRL Y-2026 TaxID=763406 RepID=A0A1E3NRE7_9ASCO|nr:hypothetical protein PICMEDRAFT_85093 [Pichia membranifaciens NRRL Y-2026]ODQ48639.1 hypothetical protein PICMEDRAFT_85093 [Pichia membranifaciens NRRL Y-2026]
MGCGLRQPPIAAYTASGSPHGGRGGVRTPVRLECTADGVSSSIPEVSGFRQILISGSTREKVQHSETGISVPKKTQIKQAEGGYAYFPRCPTLRIRINLLYLRTAPYLRNAVPRGPRTHRRISTLLDCGCMYATKICSMLCYLSKLLASVLSESSVFPPGSGSQTGRRTLTTALQPSRRIKRRSQPGAATCVPRHCTRAGAKTRALLSPWRAEAPLPRTTTSANATDPRAVRS